MIKIIKQKLEINMKNIFKIFTT